MKFEINALMDLLALAIIISAFRSTRRNYRRFALPAGLILVLAGAAELAWWR
jgi:hypothetical protein